MTSFQQHQERASVTEALINVDRGLLETVGKESFQIDQERGYRDNSVPQWFRENSRLVNVSSGADAASWDF